ncbi:hypothetical protein L1887_35458 [Cichorium endivia]|nr:hypothetical protein L1887_35458 [Cichorium endivia]
MDPLFSGLFQRKGSYLFYSVGNNGTILFVGTKRSRFILYSISTNTQWGGACTVSKGYNLTLINRLYRERLLFLGQEVDSEISNQLIGLMIYLSIEDDTKDLYLFINSPGGWVIPGVALYDTMQFVQPDVHTICMGSAASMGSFILVGGEITKRLAFPHAWRQ